MRNIGKSGVRYRVEGMKIKRKKRETQRPIRPCLLFARPQGNVRKVKRSLKGTNNNKDGKEKRNPKQRQRKQSPFLFWGKQSLKLKIE